LGRFGGYVEAVTTKGGSWYLLGDALARF